MQDKGCVPVSLSGWSIFKSNPLGWIIEGGVGIVFFALLLAALTSVALGIRQ